MNDPQSFWAFILDQRQKLLIQTGQHLSLTFISLLLAICAGLPIGILIARRRSLAPALLGIAGVLQTIPSIALLGFMIPAFGIGATPAIVALFIYALLPIIRNTYTGITGIDPAIVEAARALGLSKAQLLLRVQLPLALPVIVAGIRTAAVINVGVATLASFVAAGGLGEFIFGGISLNNTNMILAGAIPAALLAVVLDAAIAFLQRLDYQRLRRLAVFIAPVLAASLLYWGFSGEKKARLRIAFTPEFMGRQDGDLGLRSVYGLHANPKVVSDAIMYKAAYEGKLDVISGYSTDGRIKAFDLRVLKDDKGIFPPYYAAPIVREATLAKYPELEGALNLLAGRINDSIMTDLNYQTDYRNTTPDKVAMKFLRQAGLYKAPSGARTGTVRIGSKIFGEQYILAEIYRMLIEGYTSYGAETKTGLGGTKICFDALTHDGIDFYPEYTGTGLLVLLQPDTATVARVTQSSAGTYAFVDSAFRAQYGIRWLRPIGFNNSYALMMRNGQAGSLGIGSISALTSYMKR